MNYSEKKISLVGWGDQQVMLHVLNGHVGVSVVNDGKISLFGVTPWLKGLVAVVPSLARYVHGTLPKPEHAEMILQMRQSALDDAISALKQKDIGLLAEAVTTTYLAQQFMGAELLPNKGEIAKRFSGRFSLYVFRQKQIIAPDIQLNSVLAA